MKHFVKLISVLTLVTLFITSCGTPYDDTDIRNQLDSQKKEIDSLKGDVDALKAYVDEQLKKIVSLLDEDKTNLSKAMSDIIELDNATKSLQESDKELAKTIEDAKIEVVNKAIELIKEYTTYTCEHKGKTYSYSYKEVIENITNLINEVSDDSINYCNELKEKVDTLKNVYRTLKVELIKTSLVSYNEFIENPKLADFETDYNNYYYHDYNFKEYCALNIMKYVNIIKSVSDDFDNNYNDVILNAVGDIKKSSLSKSNLVKDYPVLKWLESKFTLIYLDYIKEGKDSSGNPMTLDTKIGEYSLREALTELIKIDIYDSYKLYINYVSKTLGIKGISTTFSRYNNTIGIGPLGGPDCYRGEDSIFIIISKEFGDRIISEDDEYIKSGFLDIKIADSDIEECKKYREFTCYDCELYEVKLY